LQKTPRFTDHLDCMIYNCYIASTIGVSGPENGAFVIPKFKIFLA
jgi:hypothetical protein